MMAQTTQPQRSVVAHATRLSRGLPTGRLTQVLPAPNCTVHSDRKSFLVTGTPSFTCICHRIVRGLVFCLSVLFTVISAPEATSSALACEGPQSTSPLCAEFSSALDQRARAENARDKARSYVDPPWSTADFERAEQLYQEGLQFFGDEYFGDSEPKFAAAKAGFSRLNAMIDAEIQSRESRARDYAANRDHESALAQLAQLDVWIPNGAHTALAAAERAALADRDLVAAARELMASGDITDAESLLSQTSTETYREEIRSIRAQITSSRTNERATALISQGYAHLDSGNFDAADQSFTMALSVRPGLSGALDGLAESQHRRKQSEIAAIRQRLEEHQQNERWSECLTQALALAAIDDTFDTDRVLRERYTRLTELEAALDFHLAHPERFTSKNVRSEVSNLLATPASTDQPGPRILEKRARLQSMFETSLVEYDLTLRSDGKTQVRIVPGQDLGAFKELRLRVLAGRYRVIGRKAGFREAVVNVTVPSAGSDAIVMIAADERF
jgi:tetratricopeptide (TPR) repeat protein